MNDILIHGKHLEGPFLVALDLLGTFVFALSGAAAGVKSKLDLFGLMVLAFAAGNAGGITRDLLIGSVPPAAISDTMSATSIRVTASARTKVPKGSPTRWATTSA